MAVTGISFAKVHEYICLSDPCTSKEDGATVFYWSALPNVTITTISDNQQSTSVAFGEVQSQTFKQNIGMRNRECFRRAVSGWENFPDDEGIPIVFRAETIMEGGRTYSVIAEDVMNCIRPDIINEVGDHIFKNNSMSETKRKNLEGLLSQFDGTKTSPASNVTVTTNDTEDAPAPPKSKQKAANGKNDSGGATL